MIKDKSEMPLPSEEGKSDTPELDSEDSGHPWPLGTIVGVVDDETKPNTCAIARIVAYEENGEAKAQYYGTLAKNPEQGLYKPAWTTAKNEVMLAWSQEQLKRYKVQPWYVTVCTDAIVGQIKFEKGKLSQESLSMLAAEGLETETLHKDKSKSKKRKLHDLTADSRTKARKTVASVGKSKSAGVTGQSQQLRTKDPKEKSIGKPIKKPRSPRYSLRRRQDNSQLSRGGVKN